MRVRFVLAAVAAALIVPAYGQQKPKIIAEGGDPDDRASARILYWNQEADAAAGQFAIDYGRPVWKKDYEDTAKFDAMTKGKTWRMGSNWFTSLDTQLPLNVGGRDIKPGYYFLGLYRSPDGAQWSLAFMDPAKVRTMRIDGFEMSKFPVEFKVPMTTAKADAKAEKLTITLPYSQDKNTEATLKIAWGDLALVTPVKVTLAK